MGRLAERISHLPCRDRRRVKASKFIAFYSPFESEIGYPFFATMEVARMDFQKELIAEYDRETTSTRKVLDAIPADVDFNYKPHPKSMSLGRLAGHVSDCAGDWASHTLTTDKLEFPADHKFEPYVPASKAALLEQYDRQVAKAKDELANFAPKKWDENWKFVAGGQTWIDESKYQVFRNWVLDHMIHHRAQLGVYLRMLDQKIPGCYGPSADEM
jgi:uncharacterized damage-inducible protein DinB